MKSIIPSNFEENHVQSIMDNLLLPFILCNRNSEILYANQFFLTFSGIPQREIKKKPLLRDCLKNEKNNFDRFLDEAFNSPLPTLSEELGLTFVEENVFQYAVIRIIPLAKDLFALCFNNLSVEHKLYEKYKEKIEELKKSHQQILQADKLSTMGELTASISHEISNPLTIAMGNLEVLEMSFPKNNDSKEELMSKKEILHYITNVNDSLKRISSIIENMKEYLHKSEDSKEYCRYQDIIQNSINLVLPAFKEKNIQLIQKIEDPYLVGLVNKIKIEQVLINLLKNALDALTLDDSGNFSPLKSGPGIVEIHLKKDPV